MLGVGRDLCGSSSPTPLPKQGHLQQAAPDCVQASKIAKLANGNIPYHRHHAQLMQRVGWGEKAIRLFSFLGI